MSARISMTSTTAPQTVGAALFDAITQGNRQLWLSTVLLGLGCAAAVGLALVDPRLINGVDVWDKPAKFFLSLTVQFATVGAALALLPPQERQSTGINRTVVVMTIAAWAEMAYIVFRAARGEASHFNASSIFAQVAYGLMGFGAVCLTGCGFYVGLKVWHRRVQGLMSEATGLGLMLGMVLGTLAGGYVSQRTGHWVGGEPSDAHGLWLIGWSTTGGDLRVAHFVGLHVAQALPFAALTGSRRVVYGTALAGILATALTFGLAVAGLPLLRA